MQTIALFYLNLITNVNPMKNHLLFLLIAHSSILAFPQGSWTNFTMSNSGISSPVIRALEIDQQNRVWVAYGWDGNGISLFEDNTWTSIDTANGLSNNGVQVILEDRDENIWCGTQNGLCKYDGSSWTTITTANGLANNNILSIHQSSDGKLWVGTVNGLSRFDSTNWTNYTTADGLANNYIFDIEEDQQGNMWFAFGLDPSGVTKFDGNNWTTYKVADGLKSNQVNAILADQAGNIWFGCYGMNGGVTRLDGNTWTTYNHDTLSTCQNIWDIVEDSQHNIWFGTSCDGGTFIYNNATWTLTTTNNSDIISDNMLKIDTDNDGNVWLGGYGGLSKYMPSSANGMVDKLSKNPDIEILFTQNKISVSMKKHKPISQIMLYSIDGKLVYQAKPMASKFSIKTADYSKGIYTLMLESTGKFYAGKIYLR